MQQRQMPRRGRQLEIPNRRQTLSVIVIDDEELARTQVELALRDSATARLVGEAANGMLGAELAERLQPDVIVLDLEMPVMDGFEALPLLRQVAPRAAVVVRTNLGVENAARVVDLGARKFVRKFTGPDELRRVIETAVPPAVPISLQRALRERSARRRTVSAAR